MIHFSITETWNIFVYRYQVDKPTTDDRSMFVDVLVEAVLSIPLEEISKSKVQSSLDELQKLPKEPCGPKASEVRAKAEAEQHALRRLRMCFRDICNRFDLFFTFLINMNYHLKVQHKNIGLGSGGNQKMETFLPKNGNINST